MSKIAMKELELQFDPGENVEPEEIPREEDSGSDTISVYLKSLQHTTLLTRSEEVRVAREMERYDRRARRLLSRSLPVASKVIQFYHGLAAEGLRMTDLMIFPRGDSEEDGGDVEHCEAPMKPVVDLRQEEVLCERMELLESAYDKVLSIVSTPRFNHRKADYSLHRLRVQMGKLILRLPFNKVMRLRMEYAWSAAVDDALTFKGELAKLETRLKLANDDPAQVRLLKRQIKGVKDQVQTLEHQNGHPLDDIIVSWKRFADAKQKAESFKLRMIESNLKLVVFIGRDFMGRGLAMEDLIQEGNIGLIRAVEKFDWRRGIKFSTYAVWWIKQAIQLAIANQSRTIRLPTYMVDRVNRVRRVLRQINTRVDAEPTPEEIAPLVGLTADDVRQVLNVVNEPVSLETPTAEDDGEHSLGDLLPDYRAHDPLKDSMTVETAANLREALSKLSGRESEVLMLRFGLTPDGREWTLEEIGQRFNLTRERIRQIEMRALAKLSHPSRSRKLRDAPFQ